MYVKPPRRQASGMYVPDNYHGTAFGEPDAEAVQERSVQEPSDRPEDTVQELPVPQATPAIKKEESGLLSSLFSGFGGLRSDDLLLLALIVLLWSSGKENGQGTPEILPLLALLLFMG